MIYIIISLALAAFLVLVWSLCRVGADADERAERIFEQEDNDAQQL
jgi:hypothetical protein